MSAWLPTLCFWLLTSITQTVHGLTRTCITGGYNTAVTYVLSTECYNGASWAKISSLSVPSNNYGQTAINLGSISCILGGGVSQVSVFCTNWTSPWVAMPPVPDTQRAAAIYGEGWVGVTTGVISATFPHFVNSSIHTIASPVLGGLNFSWDISLPMPSLGGYSVTMRLNGTSCLFGSANIPSRSTCLDGSSGTYQWLPGPTLNIGRTSAVSLFIGGKWCAVGGSNGAIMNSVECVDASSSYQSGNFTLYPAYMLPKNISQAVNVTLNGLSCYAGGTNLSDPRGMTDVWCANVSTDSTSVQWLQMPSLNTGRWFHASWTLEDGTTLAPTNAPTMSPTLSPTAPPTYAPGTWYPVAVDSETISSSDWYSTVGLGNYGEAHPTLPNPPTAVTGLSWNQTGGALQLRTAASANQGRVSLELGCRLQSTGLANYSDPPWNGSFWGYSSTNNLRWIKLSCWNANWALQKVVCKQWENVSCLVVEVLCCPPGNLGEFRVESTERVYIDATTTSDPTIFSADCPAESIMGGIAVARSGPLNQPIQNWIIMCDPIYHRDFAMNLKLSYSLYNFTPATTVDLLTFYNLNQNFPDYFSGDPRNFSPTPPSSSTPSISLPATCQTFITTGEIVSKDCDGSYTARTKDIAYRFSTQMWVYQSQSINVYYGQSASYGWVIDAHGITTAGALQSVGFAENFNGFIQNWNYDLMNSNLVGNASLMLMPSFLGGNSYGYYDVDATGFDLFGGHDQVLLVFADSWFPYSNNPPRGELQPVSTTMSVYTLNPNRASPSQFLATTLNDSNYISYFDNWFAIGQLPACTKTQASIILLDSSCSGTRSSILLPAALQFQTVINLTVPSIVTIYLGGKYGKGAAITVDYLFLAASNWEPNGTDWRGNIDNGLIATMSLSSGLHVVEAVGFETGSGANQVLLVFVDPIQPSVLNEVCTYLNAVPAWGWLNFQWLPSSSPLPDWNIDGLQFQQSAVVQIPPFTFPVGVYNWNVTSAYFSGGSAQAQFAILDTPFEIQILGGNVIDVCVGDGSTSTTITALWDPNIARNLTLQWGAGTCPFAQTPPTYPDSILSSSVSAQVVNPAVGTTCTLSMQAWSPWSSNPALATITIAATATGICNVSILGPTMINPGQTLRLYASLGNNPVSNLTWSCAITLTRGSACFVNGVSSSAMAFDPSCLGQGGGTLPFQLVISTRDGRVKTLTYSVTVRKPPSGGSCQFTQPNNTISRVMINCVGWTSSTSSSLLYSLYTRTPSTTSTSNSDVLVAQDTVNNNFWGNLFPGSQILVVKITDVNGAITAVEQAIVVNGTCQGAADALRNSSTRLTLTDTSYLAQCQQQLPQQQQQQQQQIGVATWTAINNALTATANQTYITQTDLVAVSSALGYLVAFAPNGMLDNTSFYANLQSYLNLFSYAQPGNINLAGTFAASVDLILLSQSPTSTSSSPSSTNSTSPLSSSSFSSSTYCTIVNTMVGQLRDLSYLAVSDVLPGETSPGLTSQTQTFSSVAQYFDSSNTTVLPSAAMNVDLPASIFSSLQTGLNNLTSSSSSPSSTTAAEIQQAVFHLASSSYQKLGSIIQCRPLPTAYIMHAPVLADVTLVGAGNSNLNSNLNSTTSTVRALTVQNTSQPITLTFLLSRPPCQKTACVWWDSTAGEWSGSGCVAEARGSTSFTCSCNHLTEFSLVSAGCPTAAERGGYAMYIAVYAIIGLIGLVKIVIRMTRDYYASPAHHLSWNQPHTQHTLLVIYSVLRAMACAVLAQFTPVDLVGMRAVILLAPYLISFWMYTTLIFGWAGLYHFAMRFSKQLQCRMNVLLMLVNSAVIITIAVLITFLLKDNISSSSLLATNDNNDQVILGGSIFLAAVTACTAVGFVVYSTLIMKSMQGGSSNIQSTSGSSGLCGCNNLSRRLFSFALFTSTMLLIQSILHVVSMVNINSYPFSQHTIELVLLATDVCFLLALLTIYHTFMSRSAATRSSAASPNKNKSLEA